MSLRDFHVYRASAHSSWATCAALSFLLTLTLSATGARAAADVADPTAGCRGTWEPDARPAPRLVVECRPGFASPHDRVFIYPRRPIPSGGDWRRALDTRDAVWLFDAGALGRASLILDFHPDDDGKGAVADVYDDPDGRGSVPYRLGSGIPRAAARFPTVRVRAPAGWWVRDGMIDYDLDITVDGTVPAAFGSEAYVGTPRTDAAPTTRIRVRDDDHDGRPDWELIGASPPVPDSSAVIRGELMVSPRGDAPIAGAVFWPLLGTGKGLRRDAQGRVEAAPAPPGDDYGIVKGYNRSPPPIQVDWSRARIDAVGEIVASRGSEDNWFVYSLTPLDGPARGPADFENPFDFYDLAGVHDGYPDLAIRHEYYPARDPYYSGGRSLEPSELVRYSWDQEHLHERWGFKVDLLGRHAVTTALRFGDSLIPTLPHDSLPAWVTGQRWDVAQFVAAEGGAWTSEGIAEEPVDMLRARDRYLTGLDATPPSLDAARVATGYRAELEAPFGDRPWLAVSAVDHELHLAGAQAGIWRVSGRRLVRYASTGGAGIDSWSVEDDGREVMSLHALGGQLLLADSAGVRVRPLPVPLEAFRTLPPSSRDTWTSLGEELRAARPPFSGDDLAAMFDQFSGPVTALPGASLRDVRATSDGFQLVLDVPDDVVPAATAPVPARRSAGASPAGGYPPPLSPVRENSAANSGGGQAPAPREITTRNGDEHAPAGVAPRARTGAGFVQSPCATLCSIPTNLSPGTYLVRYRAPGGYSVEPATPPSLAVTSIEVSGSEATALNPLDLSTTIRNIGHETAHGVGVTLVASRQGGPAVSAGQATLDVPGDGAATARIAWTPPSGGEWSVRTAVNGTPLPGPPLHVSVATAPSADPGALLAAQGVPPLPVVASAVLAAAAAIAGGLMGALWACRDDAADPDHAEDRAGV